MSVTLHVSGTINHMIIIYGTLVQNGNISKHFFSFFQNFDFLGCWVVGVKGQKAVQNDKRFCPLRLIFQEPYII